jgi:virginiamycin A acetyltransferase
MRQSVKNCLKGIVDLICIAGVSPLYLFYLCLKPLGLASRFFADASQFLSLVPGLPGCYLRKNFYRLTLTRCDRLCLIQFGTILAQQDIEIGRGVYIGAYCNIGTCKIEDHCTLGSNVHILSGRHQHQFEDLDVPIQSQGGCLEKVRIGTDSWIGNGAVVMANVGKKCIIGAGSVVAQDIEDYSIVTGNPAKIIRKRI